MTEPDGRPPETAGEPTVIAHTEAEEARHRERDERQRATIGERWTSLCFAVSIVGALGLAIVYWQGGQPQLEGIFLGLAIGGIGVGMVIWARQFMPDEQITEERHPLPSTEEEIAEFREEFQRGEHVVQRRGLLVKMAGAAVAALGAALLFPIRSLGPRPGRGFKVTAFEPGVRLVNEANRPLRPADIVTNGVVTAFPEDFPGSADAPTLLIRPDVPVDLPPEREDWGHEGLVAYSKLCTHVGCPVGLYQAQEHLLLCPCHQSTFDVLDGCEPVFGPAARPLPQLPIAVDDEGYLISTGDFSGPTGAGFWDRGR